MCFKLCEDMIAYTCRSHPPGLAACRCGQAPEHQLRSCTASELVVQDPCCCLGSGPHLQATSPRMVKQLHAVKL